MDTILLKIKRQDDPSDLPYWELFDVAYEPGMSVARALDIIGENPITTEGHKTSPVNCEMSCLEGMCGSCTMIINGKVRQSCRTSVDDLDQPIVLEPMTKFPVVRDLIVDRTRMFDALDRSMCWIALDGMHDRGAIAGIGVDESTAYDRFWGCVMCGSCVEACPQVNDRSSFAGAFVFSHVMIMNRHPLGRDGAASRLGALAQRGGLADCHGAENCTAVCPKGISLTEAISWLGLEASKNSIRQFFRGW